MIDYIKINIKKREKEKEKMGIIKFQFIAVSQTNILRYVTAWSVS
jgi:hypothetical protein